MMFIKLWDKVNSFLDKHFETIKPSTMKEEPQVRKFYKITIRVGNLDEEIYEYYSTATLNAVYEYAKNTLEDYARHAAMEYYWYEGKEDEDEEEFYQRFYLNCNYLIKEIPEEEYNRQIRVIWRTE